VGQSVGPRASFQGVGGAWSGHRGERQFRGTPLYYACANGNVAVVNELLNPNDSNGTTTTILGKRKSRGGANIEAKDDDNNAPLHVASLWGYLAVVKALLSSGVDILAANNDGELQFTKQ
jgi:ankyrin repeat protein